MQQKQVMQRKDILRISPLYHSLRWVMIELRKIRMTLLQQHADIGRVLGILRRRIMRAEPSVYRLEP